MRVLNIPNTLTILRILIIPAFITAMIYGIYTYGLYLFAFAALTDMLDGLSARLTSQKTALGTFLDPLADKFLLVSSFVLFSVCGWIPKWFAITVISRDLIVVIGWFLLYLVTRNSRVEPVLLGKIATALELATLAYVLLGLNFSGLPPVPGFVLLLIASVTVASGLQYVYKGFNATNAR